MPAHRHVLTLAFGVVIAIAGLPGGTAAASGGYEQVVDITFPTDARASYTNDYHNARGGGTRVHRATDLMGERGWPVYAAVAGTITWMPSGPHSTAGYAIAVEADDGRTYRYIHLDRYASGMAVGVRVERGQVLGTMGSTGNATTPHLHFEVLDDSVRDPYGSGRINPYPSLVAAEERGDYGPVRLLARSVDRIAGEERVATAAALAARAFPDGAERVVLASATAYQDAIIAGPLAAVLSGPVLTTYGGALHERARAAIAELDPDEVIVIDGTDSLSPRVVEDLVDDAGVPEGGITLIEGDSPEAVASAVAERVWERSASRDALVALGSHPEPSRAWPDALMAAYYGAVLAQPVLLVDPDRVPAATAAALESVATATIIGGTEAVSRNLELEIRGAADSVTRLWGADRYATAVAVAGDLLEREAVVTDRVWAATGYDFADALSASAAAAKAGDVLVLIEGRATAGDAAVDGWFERRRETFTDATVIGGPQAISEAARLRLAQRID